MFFGTSILKAFWEGLGMVLGGQNPRFSHCFREKTQAKNKKKFGRPKNRILRPQEQIAGEARRYVRVRGKELKGWGKALELGIGSLILKASLRGRQLGRIWNNYLARSALPSGGGGCAAHVPPRCRGGRKAIVNAKMGFEWQLMPAGGCLQQIMPK